MKVKDFHWLFENLLKIARSLQPIKLQTQYPQVIFQKCLACAKDKVAIYKQLLTLQAI